MGGKIRSAFSSGCRDCGQPVPVLVGRGRPRLSCHTVECRAAAQKRRLEARPTACAVCSTPMTQVNDHGRHRRFCSTKCWRSTRPARVRRRSERKPLTVYHFTCEGCGKAFESRIRGRKRCSVTCGTRHADGTHPAARLTADYVRSRLRYEPDTGEFYWMERTDTGKNVHDWNRRNAGNRAGRLRKDGYFWICIDHQEYAASRIAWLYMTGAWPVAQIVHKDRARTNNKFDNLRQATASQNTKNRRGSCRSGLKGAYTYPKSKGVWISAIRSDGETVRLGWFETAEDAHHAYVEAARKMHGEFASE